MAVCTELVLLLGNIEKKGTHLTVRDPVQVAYPRKIM